MSETSNQSSLRINIQDANGLSFTCILNRVDSEEEQGLCDLERQGLARKGERESTEE